MQDVVQTGNCRRHVLHVSTRVCPRVRASWRPVLAEGMLRQRRFLLRVRGNGNDNKFFRLQDLLGLTLPPYNWKPKPSCVLKLNIFGAVPPGAALNSHRVWR